MRKKDLEIAEGGEVCVSIPLRLAGPHTSRIGRSLRKLKLAAKYKGKSMREVSGNLQVFLGDKKCLAALKEIDDVSLQYLILADIKDLGLRITGMGLGAEMMDFSFSTVDSLAVPYRERISKVMKGYGIEKFRITSNF